MIFLKSPEELFLETEREKILSRYIVVLQKRIRGWLQRRRYYHRIGILLSCFGLINLNIFLSRFLNLKKAALVVQSHWRARKPRIMYNRMKKGYGRLQARIQSRILRSRFQFVRQRISAFQAYCKGYAVRSVVRKKMQVCRDQILCFFCILF